MPPPFYCDDAKRHAHDVASVHGLPMPTEKLGSGGMGYAFLTEHPLWVAKVTSDPYEADFCWAAFNGEYRNTPLEDRVIKILSMFHVPDAGNVWVIWKERLSARVWSWDDPDGCSETLWLQKLANAHHLYDAHRDNLGWRVTDEGSQTLVLLDTQSAGQDRVDRIPKFARGTQPR